MCYMAFLNLSKLFRGLKTKIMCPKEEAKELYRMFRGFNNETEEMNKTTAIQCAELCVDKIIVILSQTLDFEMKKSVEHYYRVKEELNAL